MRFVPVAVTAKVAVAGATTLWFWGGVLIVGAAVFTVRVAAALVVLPAAFVTTTRYWVLFIPTVVAGVV